MSKVLVTDTYLYNIADSIRAKNGSSDTYTPLQMATAISNIPSGGSNYTLLASEEIEYSNSAYQQDKLVKKIDLDSSAFDKNKIIYVIVKDKAGKRAGYFLGNHAFFINNSDANNYSNEIYSINTSIVYDSNSKYQARSRLGAGYGVYGRTLSKTGLEIYSYYRNTDSGIINGTYKVEIYALDYPNGANLFDL